MTDRLAKTDSPGKAPYTAAHRAIAALPALPSIIRYLDEYDDEWRTIQCPTERDDWPVTADTLTIHWNFALFEPEIRLLMKHFMYWILNRKSTRTAQVIYSYAKASHSKLGAKWFLEALERPLFDWEHYWNTEVRPNRSQEDVEVLKSLLYFMCEMSLGEFRPVHIDFVRSLRFQWRDKYKGVESGESILTADEEAKIIAHLDAMTQQVNDKTLESDEMLLDTCLLCISYQHGLRPVQIGRINLEDLRIYHGLDGHPIVHFTAYHAKKHSVRQKRPFTRSIKREWALLFVEYQMRRATGQICCTSAQASETKLFPVPISSIKAAMGSLTKIVCGNRRSATELRHSAAQRLADAGASLEEIAEFLGHAQEETSMVYFEASPTQAAKVNRALAISPIYRNLLEVAKTGTINKAALLGLPADNQAAGVPHGIPIAGIGACTLGQSLCSKNPVLSCYTCPKFLPLNEPDIHKEALAGLRSVVRFFYDESKGDNQSPAFVQMRTTLESIQAVIRHLEDDQPEGGE